MITEKSLRLFRNNIGIINESLPLPNGTKSAKVITHVDLDGVVSAISMVYQLQKQGIPKERITIEFAQYGDDEKQKRGFTKKFQNKNSSQWVGVTDFAKLPKKNPYEIFNKLMSFKGNKFEFVKFANSRDFSKIANEEDFKKVFSSVFTFTESKFSKGNIEDLYDCLKAYSMWGKKDEGEITPQNVEKYQLALVKPNFVSDHHSNEPDGNGVKPLSGGERGEIAAKSPSEAEFFADKYAPGAWGKEDLAAVSMVDSAKYTEEQLKNTIFLEKHFTGPDKKKNLASIIAVLYDNLVKKDERVCKWVIMNSGPNLVSLYSNTLKALKFNGDRLATISALKKGDYQTGKEIAEALPKILKKNWTDTTGANYVDRNGTAIKKGMDIEEWRAKNNKDLENAKTGRKSKADDDKLEEIKGKRGAEFKAIRDEIKSKKGKMFQHANFTLFDGGDKKTQYSRYMTSLYSVNGSRTAYSLRYWKPSMFQISVNTIYSGAFPTGTELVDFSVVNKHVIDDVCAFLKEKGMSDFSINKVKEKMLEKNGGHKNGIWTFSGFDAIKTPSKELSDKYWDDDATIKRADKLEGGAEKFVPKTLERHMKEKAGPVKTWDEIRAGAFEKAMNSAVKWTNKLYPPKEKGLETLKNKDERFEGK